jgi:hypothetical protein
MGVRSNSHEFVGSIPGFEWPSDLSVNVCWTMKWRVLGVQAANLLLLRKSDKWVL